MKLVDLRDLLLSTGITTYHYVAQKEPDNYIVWAEEGQGNCEYGDDKMTAQGIRGTIQYFTKVEFDPLFDLIQEKLNSVDMEWTLESVDYDKNTKYIHYEWSFEITNNLV